jgi:lipopolysaccharide biosynthesis glycosyltransferase
MRVICATDNEYVLPLLVAIYSAKNNATSDFDVTVAYFPSELSHENLIFLSKVLEYIGVNFEFKALTLSEHMTQKYHITPTSYSRLLCADQFTGLVMWLDADTLCLPGWDSIYLDDFNIPHNATLSVVRDPIISRSSIKAEKNESIIKMGEDYFNSGIALIDCDRWKELNFQDQWPQLLVESNLRGFEYADQCVLNFMCSGEVKYISPSYNVFAATRRKEPKVEPLILHFAGTKKPWFFSKFDPRILNGLLLPKDVYRYLRYQTRLIRLVKSQNTALGLSLLREKRRLRRKV